MDAMVSTDHLCCTFSAALRPVRRVTQLKGCLGDVITANADAQPQDFTVFRASDFGHHGQLVETPPREIYPFQLSRSARWISNPRS